MNRSLTVLALAVFLLSGCASAGYMAEYEGEDLLAVRHNEDNDYMLLVYRDTIGQTRQVLRRNGVCEIVMTYTIDGKILLKRRGKKENNISPKEAGRITHRINRLLQKKPNGTLSST